MYVLATLKKQLEEDSQNILNFMASNGLVANPKKQHFFFLMPKIARKNHWR